MNDPRRRQGPIVGSDDARAGETRHHVRYILAISLLAVIVVFALLFGAGAW